MGLSLAINQAKISEGLSKVEFMIDSIYNETDHRICKEERSEILATLYSTKNDENVVYNWESQPLYVNKAAEVAYIYPCKKVLAKFTAMHKTGQCCDELPVNPHAQEEYVQRPLFQATM